MGNGLSDKTCEDASSNGLLLASSVLQEMYVSQELLACFDLFSLLGHSCHSHISHLVGILFSFRNNCHSKGILHD